jgi:glyceraldehyde 3-phosphate dehydrogenase
MQKEIRVGINGFGRIGRMTARALMNRKGLRLVAVNDIADAATLMHLFKYDSVHGKFNGEIGNEGGSVQINGMDVAFYSESQASAIPWSKHRVDVVLECSGKFKNWEETSAHLKAGAPKVIISAPSSDPAIKMVVLGVNDGILDGTEQIISNASCTTNNAAPLIQLIDELCGINSCYITTIHSYTGDQRLHDAPHPDLRRARAAAQSIVPTTTGAAKALTRIFPNLAGAMGGCGIRVPVPDGSLTDITCSVQKVPSVEAINEAFKIAASSRYAGILEYTEDPVVSVDVLGNPHSCLFDAQLTSVIGNMVKVVGWYDNEIGYSNRMLDLAQKWV